jgi:FdhD protein
LHSLTSRKNEFFSVPKSGRCVRCRPFTTYKDSQLAVAEYALAVEEPLEIFIDGFLYRTTMRTPGDDLNLAVGFCYTENLIDNGSHIGVLEEETDDGLSRVVVEIKKGNTQQTVRVANEVPSNGRLESARYKDVPRALNCKTKESPTGFTPIAIRDIFASKQALESRQKLFSRTRCTHACAVFEKGGLMLSFAEDVGRHNALDKAVGVLVRGGRQRQSHMVLISSRLSAEIVRKADRLGIEVLAGMSAPTDKAVEMAFDLNLTLIGSLRSDSLTIFTHPQRLNVR